MKIGINASFLRKPDTGIGQVTRGFINELLAKKSRNRRYFLYLEEDTDLNLPQNFEKRVFLPMLWKRDDLIRKIWWEKFLLPRKVKKDKCDVFVSFYPCPTFLPKNIRHKMLVHDMIWKVFPEYLDNWRKKFYAWLSWKAAKDADEIYTVSEWSARDIHKYLKIPKSKIKVAYPSVGDEFFEKKEPADDNKILEKYGIYGRYVFYIGGFDFRKNIPGLLKAYARMIERYEVSDVKLVLAGENKSRFSPLFTDIKKEVADLKIENNVKAIGFVEQKDMPALYRQCELSVLPSLYEGFGLMVFEAMASGAPAVVSKSSSLIEIGRDAVLYFNPYDEKEMARVMAKVLRNEKLKRILSEKGRKRAKNFSWKKFTEKILS